MNKRGKGIELLHTFIDNHPSIKDRFLCGVWINTLIAKGNKYSPRELNTCRFPGSLPTRHIVSYHQFSDYSALDDVQVDHITGEDFNVGAPHKEIDLYFKNSRKDISLCSQSILPIKQASRLLDIRKESTLMLPSNETEAP